MKKDPPWFWGNKVWEGALAYILYTYNSIQFRYVWTNNTKHHLVKRVYVGVIPQPEKFESPPCLIGRQTVLQERKEADALSEQERARSEWQIRWKVDRFGTPCVDGGTPCIDGRDVDSVWIYIRNCLHKMTLSKTEKTLRVVCNVISVWCLVGGLSLHNLYQVGFHDNVACCVWKLTWWKIEAQP